jgi:hypothetical protein
MGLVGFAPNLTDCIGGQGKNKFKSSGANDWVGFIHFTCTFVLQDTEAVRTMPVWPAHSCKWKFK